MIKKIKLTNFLSFSNESQEIELRPLNVIIGANGSGKSNFLESFYFLQNLPSNVGTPIREGGGISEWLYKGLPEQPNMKLELFVDNPCPRKICNELYYAVSFSSAGFNYMIIDEQLKSKEAQTRCFDRYIFYEFKNGQPFITLPGHIDTIKLEDVNPTQSILEQIRDETNYREITYLAREFKKIKIYREWQFGKYSPVRQPQRADMPNQYLEPDCTNLGLVLNQIERNAEAKKRLLSELKNFYNDVEDFYLNIFSNTIQIYFHESGLRSPVPATRLSDGTLRYLCLLAILCNPNKPPVLCIEEPELGLHPDVFPGLSRLIQEASQHCQIIVTTHSDIFVDTFNDIPEAILVSEKDENGTSINRLNHEELKPWLEKYRLGRLWMRGEIGGTRW